MPDNGSENNPIIVALTSFFKPLLEITAKLDPVLAYSLSAVLAILVLVLLGVVLPTALILLVGIVLLAGLSAFVYIDWLNRKVTPPPLPPRVVYSPLGLPASGKLGILVDLSHQQGVWKPNSIFDLPAERSNLISLVIPPTESLDWDVKEIKEIQQFKTGEMGNWRGLIFGMPHHNEIGQEVLDAIVEWVTQGGHLILLGYELGERHHLTHLNLLSDRYFGIRFNSDIVAPANWLTPETKAYDHDIVFQDLPPKPHPILDHVKKLCMRNICTLTVEPGSNVILSIGNNKLHRLLNPNYVDSFTSSGNPEYELAPVADWLPIIAEAPQGLCGKGKVIAIGTWYFFGAEESFKVNDNFTFVRNLLKWSVTRI